MKLALVMIVRDEARCIGRALESPIFGWGGWGRARVYDDEGRDVTVTDGLWIIAFGDRGMVGLVALGGALAQPALRMLRRYPPRLWASAPYGVGAVLAVNLALFFIDGIANAMINPVFLLSAGGLNGLIGTVAEPKAVPGQMANLLRPKRAARKFAASPSMGDIS